MSPVSPPAVRPGVWLKVSQMDGVRPSSRTAPSIWYAEVAAPQRKTEGKATGVTGVAESGMEALPLWSLRTDESADEEEEGRAGPYRTGVGREDGRRGVGRRRAARDGDGPAGRPGASALHGTLHDAAHDLLAEDGEHDQQRQRAQQRTGHDQGLVRGVAAAECRHRDLHGRVAVLGQ